MKRSSVATGLVVFVILYATLAPRSSRAQVPGIISYQGRLVAGGGLVNSNVEMVLRLYNANPGGTLAYEDSNTVSVVGGVGIGTNAPRSGLHVAGGVGIDEADPSKYVALIENQRPLSGSDVLALKVNVQNPGSGMNFITFFNNLDQAMGRIEGAQNTNVVYLTTGSDYAEFLPRSNAGEVTTARQKLVVGRAWESSDSAGIKKVNTSIGLGRAAHLVETVHALETRLAAQSAEIERLRSMLEMLAGRLNPPVRRADR